MRARFLLVFSAFLAIASARQASAQTVIMTFEEPRSSTEIFDDALSIYGDIEFLNHDSLFGTDTWRYTNVDAYPYTAHSGTTRAYFTYSDATYPYAPFRITSAGTTFAGAWLAGPEGYSTVGFNLFYGGALVHTSAPAYTSSTPTFLATGYAGPVDSVYVVSNDPFSETGSNGFWVLDDFEYTLAESGTVAPEPASIALVATGLLGLGGVSASRRRRQGRSS